MSTEFENVDYVRFVPSRIFGWYEPKVEQVIVYPDRLVIGQPGSFTTYPWSKMAWRVDSVFAHLQRFVFEKRHLMVGERSYCRNPLQCYFIFHTRTPLTICMPSDDVDEYGSCCFVHVKQILASGGFGTFDLN